MTLSTNIYVLDEIGIHDLFRFCQGLLTKYDDRTPKQTPEQQEWTERESTWRNGGSWSISNNVGQGLPAILDIGYRPGAPLATEEQASQCTDDCDTADDLDPDDDPAEDRYHSHPRACWADIDFDTTYSYRDVEGRGCGDLHALLVAEVGHWLDERGVRWEWRNEFTGDVHGGEDRYRRLVDLASGGFEASAWFRASVLPAIMASVEHGGAA